MCCRSKQQRQVERLEQGRHAHSGPQAGVGSKRPSFDGRPDYVDRTVPRVSPSIGEASRQSLSESAPPAYASIEKASGPYDTVASDQAHSIPADAGRSVALKRHGRGVAYAESTVCNELGHKEKRRYGTVGIIGGIVFFPWGLFWTACDSTIVCTRCHVTVRGRRCEEKCKARAAREQARLQQQRMS